MKYVVLAAALLMSGVSMAQDVKQPRKVDSKFRQVQSPEDRASRLTEEMTTELSLTSEQVPKVSEINLGIAKKNEGVRNNPNISEDQKKEIYKNNEIARSNMLKSVLTAEQFAKYEASDKAKKENASKTGATE